MISKRKKQNKFENLKGMYSFFVGMNKIMSSLLKNERDRWNKILFNFKRMRNGMDSFLKGMLKIPVR